MMGKVSGEVILNTKKKEIAPLLEEILGVLRRYLEKGRYRIFLYGSWASLQARPTSDLDIAVLGSKPIDDMIFLKIKEELDNLPTLRTVDIVDLGRAEKVFRDNVLGDSEELSL